MLLPTARYSPTKYLSRIERERRKMFVGLMSNNYKTIA